MQAKVVLIGLATVGKSTIRERYLGIEFRPAYLQTVGADFTMKEQVVEGNQSVILQIWDLAGQQGFSNIRESFYKGTDGAILVFDVNNQNSAESIKDWIKELSLQKKSNIPLLLVGNKIDLRSADSTGSLTHEEGLKLAKSLSLKFKKDIQYIESSAKTGENINLIFSTMANLVYNYKNKFKKQLSTKKDFEKFYEELNNYVQLYFFKMTNEGPTCVLKTVDFASEEILTKMGIYYSTSLGQGSSEHTGLFGPFPIPKTDEENFSGETGDQQCVIYSFKKTDSSLTDVRAKGINFCFIVVIIPKDLTYQVVNNTINRFFFDNLNKVVDVAKLTDDFMHELKKDLLSDLFLIYN